MYAEFIRIDYVYKRRAQSCLGKSVPHLLFFSPPMPVFYNVPFLKLSGYIFVAHLTVPRHSPPATRCGQICQCHRGDVMTAVP